MTDQDKTMPPSESGASEARPVGPSTKTPVCIVDLSEFKERLEYAHVQELIDNVPSWKERLLIEKGDLSPASVYATLLARRERYRASRQAERRHGLPPRQHLVSRRSAPQIDGFAVRAHPSIPSLGVRTAPPGFTRSLYSQGVEPLKSIGVRGVEDDVDKSGGSRCGVYGTDSSGDSWRDTQSYVDAWLDDVTKWYRFDELDYLQALLEHRVDLPAGPPAEHTGYEYRWSTRLKVWSIFRKSAEKGKTWAFAMVLEEWQGAFTSDRQLKTSVDGIELFMTNEPGVYSADLVLSGSNTVAPGITPTLWIVVQVGISALDGMNGIFSGAGIFNPYASETVNLNAGVWYERRPVMYNPLAVELDPSSGTPI